MNMSTEPIRLPALIALVVVIACVIALSLLLHLEPENAVALVLGVLGVFAPALAFAESKRARTDSPATIDALHAQYAARNDSAGITELGSATLTLDLATPPELDDPVAAKLGELVALFERQNEV